MSSKKRVRPSTMEEYVQEYSSEQSTAKSEQPKVTHASPQTRTRVQKITTTQISMSPQTRAMTQKLALHQISPRTQEMLKEVFAHNQSSPKAQPRKQLTPMKPSPHNHLKAHAPKKAHTTTQVRPQVQKQLNFQAPVETNPKRPQVSPLVKTVKQAHINEESQDHSPTNPKSKSKLQPRPQLLQKQTGPLPNINRPSQLFCPNIADSESQIHMQRKANDDTRRGATPKAVQIHKQLQIHKQGSMTQAEEQLQRQSNTQSRVLFVAQSESRGQVLQPQLSSKTRKGAQVQQKKPTEHQMHPFGDRPANKNFSKHSEIGQPLIEVEEDIQQQLSPDSPHHSSPGNE